MNHSHLRLAASVLAATILSSAPGFAQSLGYNDPQQGGFPFPPLFQSFDRQPEPQALPQERVTEEDAPGVVQQERFHRQIVSYRPAKRPAPSSSIRPTPISIYVLGNGQAIRYGIGVGREGFTWAGVQVAQEGMAGLVSAGRNDRAPALSAALHGRRPRQSARRARHVSRHHRYTASTAPTRPATIGKHVSSGCIRLTNEDVTDLYQPRERSAPRWSCCR